MVTDKLKELEETRAKLAKLEEAARTELTQELKTLPEKYGFPTTESFIAAVRAAAGPGSGRRGRPPKGGSGAAALLGGSGKARKPRAVITDETRAQLKKMVKEGKTGAEIAQKLDISLPSVQNIKKALGLVNKR